MKYSWLTRTGGAWPCYERSSRSAVRWRAQVDWVPRRFAEQNSPYLLGRLGSQLDEPFDAVERRVRSEKDTGMVTQAGVVERLALDHVEASGRERARVERGEQGRLVDTRPARGVDRIAPSRIRARLALLIR